MLAIKKGLLTELFIKFGDSDGSEERANCFLCVMATAPAFLPPATPHHIPLHLCGYCGEEWRPEVHVDKSHFVRRTTSGGGSLAPVSLFGFRFAP